MENPRFAAAPFSGSATAPSSTLPRQQLFVVCALLVALVPGRFLPCAVSDTVPATTKYREVVSVSGSVGQIPCPVTSFEDVVMILWFKGSSGAPIYSYDARNEEVEPRHMTLKDEWGLRLYFRVWPNNRRSPALMIQDLKPGDGGLYRCRVDYRNSPTTNAVTRLRIIEPPTRLEIRDTSPSRPISDQQMMIAGNNKHSDPSVTYMGPYTEGQNVTLVCNAYGGNPSPEVRWFKNGDVVDTSFSLSGTEYTVNEMTINNLGRNHTSDIYSCQANNNNETQALTHKVLLEIYFGVTSVELEIPSPMTAGTEYNLVCRTYGSYPTVKVEFWKNLKRIASRSQMKSVPYNATLTSIVFKPDVGDDGSTIVCKAENPWVSRKPTVARKTMKIKYAPVAVLRLGRNRTTAFSEGESVLMECHVKANPPAHTIHWFHQGRQLEAGNNETVGIRISGMTLFVSYLSYHVGGDFNCEAVNDVGKGISNTLSIELHLSPKCVSSEATILPSSIGETQWLTCNILAWPSDLNFYWTLNRSDSKNNGEIRSIMRNLTENRLPISPLSSRASDGDPNTKEKTNSSSASPDLKKEYEKGKAEQLSKNQNGSPQLSSGSSSESLDYPEDQHIPVTFSSSQNSEETTMSKTNADTEKERIKSSSATASMRNPVKSKAKRSTRKNTMAEQELYHPSREEAISGKSMTYSSSSNVVFSTSKGNATSFTNSNNNFNNSSSITSLSSSPASFTSDHDAKLTSTIGTTVAAAENGDRDEFGERKTKRHVSSSTASSSTGSASTTTSSSGMNNEGKTRDVRFQDKIRHTSFISYQVKSDEDYGTVACWASNSFGNQIFPCLFHIIKRDEDTSGNKKMKTKGLNGTGGVMVAQTKNLTALSTSVTSEKEQLQSVELGTERTSPHLGFSKLQKTLGLVLLLILIFIAVLTGLAFAMLFIVARRQSREIRRIVIAHGPTTANSRRTSSERRGSNFTNRSGNKGGSPSYSSSSVVNKNVSTTATKVNETTFPCSHDMFVVSTKAMHPFQEIAEVKEDRNKEKPQLSYISTTETTTVANKAPVPNNREKDIQTLPSEFMCLPNSSTEDDCVSPERIMDTSHGNPISDREGFKSMTPRAVELLGGDIGRSYFSSMTCPADGAPTQIPCLYNNDNDSSSITTADLALGIDGTSNCMGLYQSHLDKDCLLSPNDNNTFPE